MRSARSMNQLPLLGDKSNSSCSTTCLWSETIFNAELSPPGRRGGLQIWEIETLMINVRQLLALTGGR
jgi:hypothetical protein